MKMRYHKNSFMKLAKCSGTPPDCQVTCPHSWQLHATWKARSLSWNMHPTAWCSIQGETLSIMGTQTKYDLKWLYMVNTSEVALYKYNLCLAPKLTYFIQFECNFWKCLNGVTYSLFQLYKSVHRIICKIKPVKSTLKISCFDWKW